MSQLPVAHQLTVAVKTNDHVRGAQEAAVTLVEYGDYECPRCAAVAPIVTALLVAFPDELRFVFRHFPLTRLHPHAEFAAFAAEAAGQLGAFWPLHDLLFKHQLQLHSDDILRYASGLFTNQDAFVAETENPRWRNRVQADVRSGLDSGVNGTPTFFINGVRYDGAQDRASLEAAIRVALATRF